MDHVQFFKCLSDETRLSIVMLIAENEEQCVCDLTDKLQLGERIFNSMTGIFISGSESSLKLVSPLYDEIDVFDDGMDLDKTA